ncbi:MAG: putative N-acetylmannosamine-6-phosphate 2-epimerase, partial [Candidatus Eremiobacteraeota bacterium]|nr:putative N-acetylmannosamine-6-phosphate 2-epimerase [Candidatus Eremiobacteraeota bacterium]
MNALDDLRGGLIVSVQAWPGSAIDRPEVIAAMARAAQEGGAFAVRVQGVANLTAVRAQVEIPIVGLIKRPYSGFEPYITPTAREVAAVVACGAEIVALDATDRPRPTGGDVHQLIDAVHDAGRIALADCSSVEDARVAFGAGADVLATTLCGYTKETAGHPLPALDLIAALRDELGKAAFIACEGGVHRPAQVRAAFAAGASAVVVGTAITNVDWL